MRLAVRAFWSLCTWEGISLAWLLHKKCPAPGVLVTGKQIGNVQLSPINPLLQVMSFMKDHFPLLDELGGFLHIFALT